MIELATVMLTLGAVMYYTLDFDISTIVFVGFLIFVFFGLSFRSRVSFYFGLIMAGMLILGALSIWRVDSEIPNELFGSRAFTANVVSVDKRLDRTLVVVRDDDFQKKIQLSILGNVDYLPRDKISIRGHVSKPKDFVTDNGRIFGYISYLGSKGIVGVVSNANTVLVEKGNFSPTRLATIIRYKVAEILAKNISFPFDGVIAGMIVGYQGGLPQNIQEIFRNTGVLHVLVLSGYNIALLAGFLALLLRKISFKLRSVVTMGAIILLVLISGAGVASVRAGIMGSITLLAGLAVRTYQPMRALFLAYILFFFLSPQTIFVDPGFHLSFLATLFMVAVLPKVEKIFSFVPSTKYINTREIVMLAVSIPFFMLPYIMYFSGNFPIVSPLANILMAIVTPIIMSVGILIILISWITPLSFIVGYTTSAFGKLIILLLDTSSRMPMWNTPTLSWWGVLTIYLGILFILFRPEIKNYFLQMKKMLRPQTN